MKKRLFPALLALVLALTMLSVGVFASSDPSGSGAGGGTGTGDTSLPSATDGVIQLTKDVTLSTTYKVNTTVEIDLNGHNITGTATPLIKVVTNGALTVKDSTATTAPVMSDDYKTVTYTSGAIKPGPSSTSESKANGDAIQVVGGTLTVESGKIEASNLAIAVNLTGKDATANTSSKAVINGGYITGREGGILVVNGGQLEVKGGVVEGTDNGGIMGNGSSNLTTETTITVSGGSVIGKIASSGYSAIGIYHPQKGTLNISGGEVVSVGGLGVVVRAGSTNVTNGVVKSVGTFAGGKVGDASYQFDKGYGIVYDVKSSYPGKQDTDATTISGGKIGGVIGMIDSDATGTTSPSMTVSGGTFDKPVDPKYLDDSLKVQAKSADGNYTYHVSEEAAKQAAGNDAVLGNITNDGKVEPIIKIKATGFIWDVDDKAKIAEAKAAGVTTTDDWVDQTIWVAFDQALPTGTYYWFDVEINGKTYGIAANGDGTHAAQAFSFLNLGQWEVPPSDLADAGTGLKDGVTVSAVNVTVYKSADDLSNKTPTDDQRKAFEAVDTPKTVTVPAKPTNANPNLKITSVTTDAPLYAKVTISGMDKSKVYAIRLANSTGKDASMVILIVDNTETYDIYCKDQQKIWVFEYASKNVIVEGDSQHTSLEYGVASKMTTPTAP